LDFAKRLPARLRMGGPKRNEEVASGSRTISAISKEPPGSGLAMSRIPGCVVPGPFGSLTSFGGVVGTVHTGEVVGDAEGAFAGEAEPAAEGAPPAGVEVDRGSSGPSR
jgi:hypothetical protein